MSKCCRFSAALFAVAVAVLIQTQSALADPLTFHIIDINEVYSNADGSKQFVELIAGSAGQTNLGPTWVIALNANGTDTNVVFDFTTTFPALGTGETLLLATQDLADDLGFQPDFVIPPNSLFLADGRVIFEDPPPTPTFVDAIAYGAYSGSNTNYGLPAAALPSDGCHSLQRTVQDFLVPDSNNIHFALSSGGATPRKNDGTTATLPCAPVAPVLAAIGAKSANEGQVLSFGISATDGNADPITLTAENVPVGANFTDNGNGTGSFSWTPSYLQATTYNVLFIASDGPTADSEDVQITVSEITDPAIARDTTVSGTEDIQFVGTLLGSDPDSDPRTFVIISGPFRGAAQGLNGSDGSFTYNPTLNLNGLDSLLFTVSDNIAPADTGKWRINVGQVNDPPTADNVQLSTNVNVPVSAPPMPIDDVDDVSLTVTHDSGPFHGTVTNFDMNLGIFDYTPDLDFVGRDSIFYHANDDEVPGNTAIIFVNVTGGCDCTCHADPTCDGNPTVLDVVNVVTIAFRNGTDTVDPTCSHVGRTDTNCDCAVDILDVVNMVGHAFRNDVTPFCDACAQPCP